MRRRRPREMSLHEFCLKLARELPTVGVRFGEDLATWRLKTCSLDTCNRQFWTTTISNHRFPVCSDEHREELTRRLNNARQKRYQHNRKRRRA